MIHYFINSPAFCIPADSPAGPISLIEAIDEIRLIEGQGENNFIGFINSNDDTIQFVSLDEGNFLIDIPVIKNGVYAGSKQSILNKDQVTEMIRNFFSDDDN